MPEQIKAYRCRFRCGKIGTQKRRLEEHESWCFWNPQSRSCKTCDHLADVECLKLGIDFQHAFKLQTQCRHYDNGVNGIQGVDAPERAPIPNKYVPPYRQFQDFVGEGQ